MNMKPTKQNYFSTEMQLKYMGATQFKDFLKCPAAAIATIKGEYKQEETTSLLVGKYVDAYFDGELDAFKATTPQIFTLKGELKAEYKKANEIIDRINRDELFRKNMDGEKQVIMTGEIEGIAVKIMIDNLHPDKIVDRKIMKDCNDIWIDGERKPFWAAWGYDIQAAIYQSIVAQNIGKKLPFELWCATKETEPDLRAFRFKQETIDNAIGLVRSKIVEFDEMKRGLREVVGCGCCDYCKSVRILTDSMVEDI